jgi:ferredoxin
VVQDDEPTEFDISLTKPLGIEFEEAPQGGLFVKDVLEGGSAAESTFVWPGDVLLACGNADLSSCNFDQGMDALLSAPPRVDLKLRRPCKTACVEFPDGGRVYGARGESLKDLALKAGYTKIKYPCGKGSCGVCEMVLKSGRSENCTSIRMCKATVPACELTPWEVLTTDSPEAQEYFEKLQQLAAR